MKHALVIIIIFVSIGVLISVLSILFDLKSYSNSLPKGEGGIFLSEDGKVFRQIASTAGLEINSILFSKIHPGVIYLGTRRYGLWVSNDNGKTFSVSKNKILASGVDIYDIAESPGGDLYLAAYTQDRGSVILVPDNSSSGGEPREIYFSPLNNFGVFGVSYIGGVVSIVSSDGGFYKSVNNGKSWKVESRSSKEGLLQMEVQRNTGTIWVLTSESKIIKSADGGASWTDASPNRNLYFLPKINDIYLDQRTGILLAAADKIYESVDGGAKWKPLNLVLPPDSIPISFVGINPINSAIIYAGSGNLLYKSVDGGASWSFIKVPTSRKTSTISFGANDPKLTIIGTSK